MASNTCLFQMELYYVGWAVSDRNNQTLLIDETYNEQWWLPDCPKRVCRIKSLDFKFNAVSGSKYRAASCT